ncbi:hypothetical protein [Methylobacterium oxalidis]|uniref:Uncharacterized protein n=1 Tax=Methylobacterium oxalidis TaxID=944322 RepID=A0A512J8E7_9HYPH|nr:hypothetical protein [Methylobacterium oxalidis]GEP06221.1 hypothetical protein MOX02_42590 [Methylobacterium oxalidis]GJE32889.1 hypothetical protein LDDCCGHA_3085 [Methylobacterium oxalidis]GLS63001.1 hypothetical protein GCM10007888_13820 [Methylobacterium oxalidis]
MTQERRRRVTIEQAASLVQTLAIVAAGAWAVYTFVYEARIKPGLEPPAVSVRTDLVRAGERGDRVAIRSTVTRTNVGRTGVRILGLTYNVVGISARFGADPGRAAAFAASLPAAASVGSARDYALTEPGTVILRQGTLFEGATDAPAEPSDLNPGEAVSRDLILYADRTQFDFLRVEVSFAFAKSDEAPVPLHFAAGEGGRLSLMPRADCRAEPETCRRLKTTDFATEFSLW